MNRLQRKYFINEDGSDDNIINSIDCYEKILYHALRDYNVDYKFAFCDDINLCMYETGDKIILYKNKFHLNDSLFIVNRYKPSIDTVKSFLEEMIDSGKVVAVCTMFDMLSPYCWYQEGKIGTRNTHYCLVLGYDEEHYYFVDDPTVLVKKRFIPYASNKTIGLISKKEFLRALEVYCEIITVEIDTKYISEINKFDTVRYGIINYYNFRDIVSSANNEKWCVGRKALERVIEYTYTNKFQAIRNQLENDYFFIHLMYSRRLILKLCLQTLCRQYDRKWINLVTKRLDDSMNEWQTFKTVVIRHTIKPFDNLEEIVRDHFIKIIQVEDKLIESLSRKRLSAI